MPNNFSLVSKHTTMLDELYRQEAKTNILESGGEIVRAGSNAHTILLPQYDTDGLGDYSRTEGYAKGTANLTWVEKSFNYDRGRAITVDAMDNEETIDRAFGLLAQQLMKHKVVPELDAWRFASYAGTTGIQSKQESFSVVEDITESIMNSNAAMDEAEVDAESRYLFLTPTLLNAINALDTYKSRSMMQSFAGIISVPQVRFYTAIDLLDGKTEGEEAGGYKKSATGKNINYMIIQKSAVIQYTKHVVSKVITPAENQSMDAWMFHYRTYGLTETFDKRRKGIVCSYADK